MIKTHSIDLNAKLPATLKELGTMVILNMNSDSINHVSGNYVAVYGTLFKECHLVDVSTGDVWRMPQFDNDEYGVNGCFGDSIDDSVIYAQAQKGVEQPFRQLVKIDLKTKEPIWKVALSKAGKSKWSWAQDGEHIYYTDNKNIFTHSKASGKMLKKHVRKNEGRAWHSKFFAFSSIFENHSGLILADGWDKKFQMSVICLNPLEDKIVWELPFGKMVQSVAHKVIGNKLYLLCSSGKFYKIDLATGEIIGEVDTKQPYTQGLGFYGDGDILSAYVINDPYDKKDKGRFVVLFDLKSDNITVENFTDIVDVPSYTMDSANGIIQGNRLYWIRGHDIRVFDIAEKSEFFHLAAKKKIEEYLFLGNILYAISTEKIENEQQPGFPNYNCTLTQFG
jgi:outer membrane protein assembly factor BamB